MFFMFTLGIVVMIFTGFALYAQALRLGQRLDERCSAG